MEYIEDDPRYPPKSYSLNRSRKHPLYPQHQTLTTHYNYDYDYDYDYEYLDVNDDEEELDGEFIDKNDTSYNPRGYSHKFQQSQDAFERYPKRQRRKNQVSNFEFAPRNPLSYEDGDRDGNSAVEWSEHEKFVLLEVWGDKFLQLGRNSLRSEDWVDVAEKLSETSKIERNEAQCRQMMDVLKRKYKKEKARGNYSKWVYFNKMDMLMKQESGTVGGFSLACGVDSGEYVFMDTRVYLDRANMNDEMRDSPCESEEEGEEEEEGGSGGHEGVKGLRVLAESVQKFGEIYGKIESSKREQMMELERMRIEFQRDLELQKKQILERAQVEIAKIREEDDGEDEYNFEDEDDDEDDDDDVSGGNVSK
ncbi:unnamed protein product [Dovyalis caffra]|uniref:Myb/SANT-like DNA-binding domain-containing protein n=1 Tax=Dovyalis caffra TaxID=77055 RepID=A0AAV1RH86_9ROSI|nr:unnamed protein product [Dovyalis caffra]